MCAAQFSGLPDGLHVGQREQHATARLQPAPTDLQDGSQVVEVLEDTPVNDQVEPPLAEVDLEEVALQDLEGGVVRLEERPHLLHGDRRVVQGRHACAGPLREGQEPHVGPAAAQLQDPQPGHGAQLAAHEVEEQPASSEVGVPRGDDAGA